MPEKSASTWSTLIYGHTQSHTPGVAVETFAGMVTAGVHPTASNTGLGKMLHSVALKCGVCGNVMYAKCYDMLAAQRVLEDMEEKNVATFTALLFALAGRPCDAMVLVREMEESGVPANMKKYSSLLSSFASPGDLDHGWQAHCVVLKKVLEETRKIPMYSKCGSLEGFRKVQTAVSCQDQVCLNSVISGL
jgi:hypothetical protein